MVIETTALSLSLCLRNVCGYICLHVLHYDSLTTTIVCDVMVLVLTIFFSSLLSVDPQDEEGQTAAMLAAGGGHVDCLKYLVENEAHVNIKVRGVLGEFGAGVVFDVWEEDAVEKISFTK